MEKFSILTCSYPFVFLWHHCSNWSFAVAARRFSDGSVKVNMAPPPPGVAGVDGVLGEFGGDCDVTEFCLSSCRNLAIADMGFAAPTVFVVTVVRVVTTPPSWDCCCCTFDVVVTLSSRCGFRTFRLRSRKSSVVEVAVRGCAHQETSTPGSGALRGSFAVFSLPEFGSFSKTRTQRFMSRVAINTRCYTSKPSTFR